MEAMRPEREYVRSGVRYVIGVDEAGRGCMAGPVGVAAALYRISSDSPEYKARDSKTMSEDERVEVLHAMCRELGHEDSSTFLETVVSAGEGSLVRYQPRSALLGIAAILVDVNVINARNILNATLEGMAAACHRLVQTYNATSSHPITPQNCALLIDGNRTPWTFLSAEQRQAVCRKAERKPELRKRIGQMYPELESFACVTVVKGDATLASIALASVVAKVCRDTYAVRRMHVEYPIYKFDRHKGYCTKEHTALVLQHGPCSCHRRDYAPVAAALKESAS